MTAQRRPSDTLPARLALAAMLLALSSSTIARQSSDVARPNEALTAVARQLRDAQLTIQVPPNKGSLDRDVKKGEPLYSLPEGPSPAALFQLPQATEAFVLLVKSESIGKTVFTIHMFVPRAALLDSELRITRLVPETDFEIEGNKLNAKKPRVQARLRIEPTERYLLVYTSAHRIGEAKARTDVAAASNLGVGIKNLVVARALDGKVRLDVVETVK